MIQTPSRVEQITAKLRAQIEAGDFVDGRLPSEPVLAKLVKASRATLRQALDRLAFDGFIVRKHGVGTFINTRVLNMRTRLEEVWDFEEMIRTSGYRPSVRHLEMSLAPAPEHVAAKLSLVPGEEVLTTANIFLADDTCVIYVIDMLPAHLVAQAYRDDELHGPVYDFLERRCGQRIKYNITEIFPVTADTRLSKLLDCNPGTPLHFFEEVGFNNADAPILYSEEFYRSEYFSFKVHRKMMTLKRQ